MNELLEAEALVERITTSQSRLYAYIYSLTRDADVAWDLLQETNRLLWSRAEQYEASREFMPWALTFAFNQVRSWRKKQQRERLCFHDEATLLQVEQAVKRRVLTQADQRTVALEHCIERLGEQQRQLVRRVYHDGASLTDIAKERSTRVNTISVTLHRIRQALAACIELRTE